MTEKGTAEEATELERELLKRQIDKTIAETDALRSQQSKAARFLEWLKAVAGMGAVVASIVAVLGLWFSVSRWQDDLRQSRELRAQEQVSRAFDNLASTNTSSRLASLASLRPFLIDGDEARSRLILDVLVSQLSVEQGSIVRDAIVAVLLSSSESGALSPDTLDHVLQRLIEANRALVIGESLYGRTRSQGATTASEAPAESIGHVIASLIRSRNGPLNLSDVYCARCDFSNLELSGIDLSGSILHGADLALQEPEWVTAAG